MIYRIFQFCFWFVIWALLSWPLSVEYTIIGLFVSALVCFLTADIFTRSPRKVNPVRWLWFIYYLAVFVWECIKANIDVAYRVVHPDIPIRPGTIRVRTGLRSDAGLTFLANSVTLTPGTTSVDIDKERGIIYVHWIYVRDDYDRSAMRLAVVEKFENILKRIFE